MAVSSAVSEARGKLRTRSPLALMLEIGVTWMLDGALLALSLSLAYGVRNLLVLLHWSRVPSLHLPYGPWLPFMSCWLLWLAALAYEGIYSHGLASLDVTDRIVKALTGGLLLSAVLVYLLHGEDLAPRSLLLFAYGMNLALFTLLRPILMQTLAWRTRQAPTVAVVAEFAPPADVLFQLRRAGFAVRSNDRRHQEPSEDQEPAVAVVICQKSRREQPDLSYWEGHYDEIAIIAASGGTSCLGARPMHLGGRQIFVISHPLRLPLNRFVKRTMDLLGSLTLLVLLTPVLVLVAAAVKLTSPGPILFSHGRLGRNGKPIGVLKFRTMVLDAEERLQALLESEPHLRAEFERDFKLKSDPRVTPIGPFLRRSSLDELPQLWNVLRGQMSLVGPRPIVAAEIPLYGDAYPVVRTVKPGITGLWQTSGRNNLSYDSRLTFDVAYVRKWTIWLDIVLLIRTLQAMIIPDTY